MIENILMWWIFITVVAILFYATGSLNNDDMPKRKVIVGILVWPVLLVVWLLTNLVMGAIELTQSFIKHIKGDINGNS